jgi:hypothetical protein
VKLTRSKELERKNAAFLSVARFGPGAVIILVLLVLLGVFLFLIGGNYLAILPIAVAFVVFGVISVQIIDEKKFERKIVGQKCLVVERISRGKRGLVKIYRDDGMLDPELWSAEGAQGGEIEANATARVIGIRSIILLVGRDEGGEHRDAFCHKRHTERGEKAQSGRRTIRKRNQEDALGSLPGHLCGS